VRTSNCWGDDGTVCNGIAAKLNDEKLPSKTIVFHHALTLSVVLIQQSKFYDQPQVPWVPIYKPIMYPDYRLGFTGELFGNRSSTEVKHLRRINNFKKG
jgi:hypothetical protein